MRSFFIACFLVSIELPVQAEDFPPLEFFAGTYELVGRQPGSNGEAVLDWVTITNTDKKLELEACRLSDGFLNPTPRSFEGQADFQGFLGDWEMHCHFTSDSDNYPLFTCYALPSRTSREPGILTLWPVKWKRPHHALGCKAR